MTDHALDDLIAAVEAGTFLANDALSPQANESIAYRAFSGSLDAAKSLHDALLPGWMLPCIVSHYLNGKHGVTVELYERDGSGEAVSTHDDMARAWLIATLRAYRGMQG